MKPIAAGIDIGGTNTAFGLIDEEGNARAVQTIPTKKYPDVNEFVDTICSRIEDMSASLPSEFQLKGLGIGAPNGNYYKGTIEFAPNLLWKDVVPMAELFKRRIGLPVSLTNDANAATIGEMIYGAARGIKDFIMITLGTGVGSGIVVNGNLIYGHDGFAGEIGHTIAIHGGRLCGCGRKGCLETYVSAPGVKRTIAKMLDESDRPSKLREIPLETLNSKKIHEAALDGDEIAKEAFEYTGMVMGRHLADSVAYTSPEVIFLFGGLAKAGEMLFEPTRKHLEANLLQIYKGKVKVLPSGLPHINAAILGASALVWRSLTNT